MSTADTLPDLLSQEAPLVRQLVERHGAACVTPALFDAFTARGGDQVLFFGGDPARFPEALDVAVVLPELMKAFAGRFTVGVVLRDGEDELARRHGMQRWPALVFLRDGRYVTTIAAMQDWSVYLERVAAALDQPATRAPIAINGSDASSASCH